MKKSTDESVMLARYIANFLNEYAPSQKTDSLHTLKSYQQALLLYITFLEAEKKHQLTVSVENALTGQLSRNGLYG